MGKINNVLAMLKILESGQKYSVQDLANKLEVSKRMVKMYKNELEKAGIYLETIYGPYGGMYIIKKIIMIFHLIIMILII